MAATEEVQLKGSVEGRASEVLTPRALEFVAKLHREFAGRRQELLRLRAERQTRLDAGEELLDDLDGFVEALDPGAGRVELDTRLLVIRNHPSRPDAELEPPAGQKIDRRGFLCQHDRVPVVVVEDEGADPQPRRGVGGRHEGRDRPRLLAEVIGEVQRGETHGLERLGPFAPLPGAVGSMFLHTKPKWARLSQLGKMVPRVRFELTTP